MSMDKESRDSLAADRSPYQLMYYPVVTTFQLFRLGS